MAGDTGAPLSGAATHRRTLALLGLLAASGPGGLNRDKVIGLLWPDADETRARHSLTQALYSVRRALDADDVFVISGPIVRLNPDRISSDIQDFADFLAHGDLAGAAELYTGPFLDAVFLADAGDFERWTSAERERITHRLAEALETLSSDAESAGDAEQAVRWRRRQAALLPLDGRIAARLMRALATAGDRAGALRHAQVHASLLQQELDLSPDADIVALSEQLRAESQALPIPAPVSDDAVADKEFVAALEPDAPRSAEPRVAFPPPRAQRARVWALGLAFIVVVGALVILRNPWTQQTVATNAFAQRVVVAPFRVTGADASLAYLRDGMVELLSARLADDSAARSVDAGAVLREWRAAGLGVTVDVGRDTALALAASLGAERVVMGSVVGTPSRIVLSATMLDVATRSVAAQVTATGSADSLVSLIDRVAGRLLVSVAGQEDVLAHYTSRSLPALKEFLAGQAAFRNEEFAEALRRYEHAIERDSSFALAALNAASAADALHLTSAFSGALRVAWTSRDDLNQRDLALLHAMAGPRYPMLSTAAEHAAAWQRVVDVAPQSSDAWYALAVRLLEDGPSAGLADARARAVAALNRTIAISEQHTRARALVASLDGARTSAQQRDTFDDAAAWRVALVTGDDAARGRLRARFATMNAASLRTIVLAGHYDERGRTDAHAAMARLRARGGTPAERLTHALLDHSLAMNEGRAAEALAATERVRRVLPGADAWLRLRVLDALYADGDSTAALAALRTLTERDPWTPLSRPVTSAGALANACVVAQWNLSRGDTTDVARTRDALRAAAGTPETSPVSASPAACVALLDAWTSVVLRPATARAALQRADSLVFTPQSAGDAAQYANIALARLFARVGDSTSALAAVRRRPYMTGAPRYLASARRLEAALGVVAPAANP